MHHLGQLKRARFPYAGKVYHPKGNGENISGNHAYQMEASFRKPVAKWFNAVTTTSVKIATTQFCQEP